MRKQKHACGIMLLGSIVNNAGRPLRTASVQSSFQSDNASVSFDECQRRGEVGGTSSMFGLYFILDPKGGGYLSPNEKHCG